MSNDRYAEKQVYRVLIRAPIETVWSELVKTASPRPFFWDSGWDARAMKSGEPYRMISKDGKVVAVVGEFLEMDPPHKLVHTFRLTALDDPPSQVTYLLEETSDGVQFSLITENIVAGSKSEKSMDQGSRFIVENFKAFVETGRVKPGAQMMNAVYGLMGAFAPKALRAENWPLSRRD